MKIRVGFVSNSSTSSYVVLATKEKYDEIIAGMTEFQRSVIQYLGPTKEKCFGMDMISVSWMGGNADSFECAGEADFAPYDGDEDSFIDDLHDTVYGFKKKVIDSGGWAHRSSDS